MRADEGKLTKLPGIATLSLILSHWEWCTINNELRTTSDRRILGGGQLCFNVRVNKGCGLNYARRRTLFFFVGGALIDHAWTDVPPPATFTVR